MSYLYWLSQEEFDNAKGVLKANGFTLSATVLTPCQVMRAKGHKVMYAPPSVWSRLCVRQGSWYRESVRAGKTMLMSENRLPKEMDSYLDAILEESSFQPEALPGQAELEQVVESGAYQTVKPKDWEGIGWWDSFMFKSFFGFFRFWKRGETLKTFWLGHKANHANFVSKKYTNPD